MPKKKGKGKKGKRKGKGKKGGKSVSKADKELDIEKIKENVALWEARLNATEKSRVEYREAARHLARTNEDLVNQHHQLERDTVEVIAFLKKKDADKDAQIAKLRQLLIDQRKTSQEESMRLVREEESYKQQIAHCEEKLLRRENEIRLIQGELNMIKDFRKKKSLIQRELNTVKESMYIANKEHKDMLSNMEHKFFDEKVRLEKEAEQKIALLAERAHNEAVVHLGETARSVFRENVRLTESLNYHIKELEELKKVKEKLTAYNPTISILCETNDRLVEKKVSQSKQQLEQIQDFKKKIESLEKVLSIMTQEFETELKKRELQVVDETEGTQMENKKLRKLLEMKDREVNRVKKLARNVLEQRREVETFFLEALDQVKREIVVSREFYKQVAQEAYNKRMIEATAGKEEYPKVRTFIKNENSTNSVHRDLEEAEKWYATNIKTGKIDISELTWEQKEKVLRLLFAKMNGLRLR
uniref:Basal body-orientation factor 1 n=1 Tax=Latimeria chalumnae TaxID=7897 RepID=H3BGC4_LATCH